jgi:hypothetical protein
MIMTSSTSSSPPPPRRRGHLLPPLLLAVVAVSFPTSTNAAPYSYSPGNPTAYIDVHEVTSFASDGGIESGYEFRVPARGSMFAMLPPMGPRWTEYRALTGGDSGGTAGIASSSSSSSSSHPSHRLVLPPETDPLLCDESTGKVDYRNKADTRIFDADTKNSGYENTYLLVPRGKCSFESKARSAQRLGASGVIVRNTLDSRYGTKREYDDDDNVVVVGDGTSPDWDNTIWPIEYSDYDCGGNGARNGFGYRGEVDPSELDFDPPPYGGAGGDVYGMAPGSHNDALLTGPAVNGNLCAIGGGGGDGGNGGEGGSFESMCPTMRCLLTGKNGTTNPGYLEACCAWDDLLVMSSDGEDDGDAIPSEQEEGIYIPSLFVTMEKGQELYNLVRLALEDNAMSDGSVRYIGVVPYARYHPPVHYSTMILWALAVYAVWYSARESAKEYRGR